MPGLGLAWPGHPRVDGAGGGDVAKKRAVMHSPASSRIIEIPVASGKLVDARPKAWHDVWWAATIASPRPDSVEGIPVLLAQSFLETLAKRTGQQSPKAWDDGLRRNEILA